MAHSSLVSSDTASAPVSASATALQDQASEATKSTRSGAPPHSETAPVPPGLQDIRQTYQQSGLTGDSVELLMNSWRPTTTKAYNRYIRKWQDYVNRAKVDSPTLIDLANFLIELYKDGASHSTVNLARSAVSAYVNIPGTASIGSHPVVCRLLKGVFEQRPSLPKYTETWDVDTVMDSLAEWPDTHLQSLKQLTLRTVVLLALLSGQRGQSIYSSQVEDIKLHDNRCVIVYSSVLKQTKIGRHVKPQEQASFENN